MFKKSSRELQNMSEHYDMIKPKMIESKHVNFGIDLAPWTVKIGSNLSVTLKKEMIEFLLEYKYVFAWSNEDIRCLDKDVMVHKFRLKLIKQKLRRTKPEWTIKSKEKKKVKQYNARFLEVMDLLTWKRISTFTISTPVKRRTRQV